MEPILKESIANNWNTAFFVVIFLLLVVAKTSFFNRFTDFLQLPFNLKYLRVYNKEKTLLHPFNLLMCTVQIMAFSMFIVIALRVLEVDYFSTINNKYLLVATIVVLLLALKAILQKMIANIFNIDGLVEEYIYRKVSYFNYTAYLFLIASLLFTYVITPTKALIIVVVVLYILINLVGWFLTVKKYQSLILSKLFYFILYLCALEIAPYIIGIKLTN